VLWHGFSSGPTAAENAVLDEISRVLAGHLEHWRSRRRGGDREATSPVLIQIDGPGRSLFLDKVAGLLDPKACGVPDAPGAAEPPELGRWTVIRFDAWQYQRVAPPWWWLIKTIDQQLRDRILRVEGRKGLRGWRKRDIVWRGRLLAGDLRAAVPALLIAALLGATAWLLSSVDGIVAVLQWAATAVAAVTAVASIGYSAANALRRHLLVASPAGAKAVLQTSDPMSELMERYRFLIESSGTDVAILIDNLDRCRGDYVVELLEGIQTLFKDETGDATPAMVLYLVAADRGWLCDSYLTVYDEFKDAVQEPGRPFGQTFLDKVFDFLLRIPTVPAATSLAAEHAVQHELEARAERIMSAKRELEVRERLVALERADAPAPEGPASPNQELRLFAVRRLAELEYESSTKSCPDTEDELRELAAMAEPGPATVRHLVAGYCVQRTALLLGGHEIDDGPGAIKRLGLWTILTLRWPLLAEWLKLHPEGIEGLRDGVAPAHAGDEIAAVYALPEAKRYGMLAEEQRLDADAVRRFAIPIDVLAVATSHAEPASAEASGARRRAG
jgi:hypothetical protein